MLTDQARAILRFEESWEGVPGNREAAIRNTFGVSAVGYFQLLYRVLDDPEALEAEPMLVKRLNRVRYRRFANRSRTFTGRSATPSATP